MKKQRLSVWIPTGRTLEGPAGSQDIDRRAMRALANPSTYAAAAAAVGCAACLLDAAPQPWTWALAALLALLCAVLAVAQQHRASRARLSVGRTQAMRCNDFEDAALWLPTGIKARIEDSGEPSKAERRAAAELYRRIAEGVLSLGLCKTTGERRADSFGREFEKVEPFEFHVRLSPSSGIGYVLFLQPADQTRGFEREDAGVVRRAMRDCRLADWEAERAGDGYGTTLFVLRDASRSRAFDLTGGEG